MGALVQANYGTRDLLRLKGRTVGTAIGPYVTPLKTDPTAAARRATFRLARVRCTDGNGSGHIFIASSTGNTLPLQAVEPSTITPCPQVR